MNYLILGTSTKSGRTNAKTWGELSTQLAQEGVNLSSVKAMDLLTKNTYDHQEAQLNFAGDQVKIFLSPNTGFKGGHDYEFNYDSRELVGLGYNDLRSELKSLRGQAVELEDEETVSLIGNYTQLTTNQLRDKLVAVYAKLDVEEEEIVVDEVNLDEFDLVNRVANIEARLGIVTEWSTPILQAEAKLFKV